LKAYLLIERKAEKRDHRKLGKFFRFFFHMQDDTPRNVVLASKGWALWQEIG
jgi:threonyl-tRNA synthetase